MLRFEPPRSVTTTALPSANPPSGSYCLSQPAVGSGWSSKYIHASIGNEDTPERRRPVMYGSPSNRVMPSGSESVPNDQPSYQTSVTLPLCCWYRTVTESAAVPEEPEPLPVTQISFGPL